MPPHSGCLATSLNWTELNTCPGLCPGCSSSTVVVTLLYINRDIYKYISINRGIALSKENGTQDTERRVFPSEGKACE